MNFCNFGFEGFSYVLGSSVGDVFTPGPRLALLLALSQSRGGTSSTDAVAQQVGVQHVAVWNEAFIDTSGKKVALTERSSLLLVLES